MKKEKIRRFAAIAAAAVIAAGMSGNTVRAGAVNHTAAHKEGDHADSGSAGKMLSRTQRIKKCKDNVKDKEKPQKKFLCTVGNNGGIKVSFGNCMDGPVKLTIYTEKKNYAYTITKSDLIWKTYYISAPAGTPVRYSVDGSSGKGWFVIDYEE